jgi:hypothetical protein
LCVRARPWRCATVADGVLSVWLVLWVGEQSEEVVSVSTPLTPEADEVKNKGNEAFGGGWHLGRRGRGGGWEDGRDRQQMVLGRF